MCRYISVPCAMLSYGPYTSISMSYISPTTQPSTWPESTLHDNIEKANVTKSDRYINSWTFFSCRCRSLISGRANDRSCRLRPVVTPNHTTREYYESGKNMWIATKLGTGNIFHHSKYFHGCDFRNLPFKSSFIWRVVGPCLMFYRLATSSFSTMFRWEVQDCKPREGCH